MCIHIFNVHDGILAYETFPSFIPRRRCLVSGGTKHEGKQAQIGLRLPDSGPETSYETVQFRNVKISALISPCLPKYGRIGLKKRGAPRPFKSRLVFPGGFACLRRDRPCNGSLARSFFFRGWENLVYYPIFEFYRGEI
jgi:hypothetical protein